MPAGSFLRHPDKLIGQAKVGGLGNVACHSYQKFSEIIPDGKTISMLYSTIPKKYQYHGHRTNRLTATTWARAAISGPRARKAAKVCG